MPCKQRRWSSIWLVSDPMVVIDMAGVRPHGGEWPVLPPSIQCHEMRLSIAVARSSKVVPHASTGVLMEATWPPISGDCGKATGSQSTLACLTVWSPSAP